MLTTFAVLLPLVLALLAAPAAATAGAWRSAYTAPVGTAFAGLGAAATLWGWFGGGGVVNVLWAPTWDLHFAVALDGLATLYALLATGIGFAVLPTPRAICRCTWSTRDARSQTPEASTSSSCSSWARWWGSRWRRT